MLQAHVEDTKGGHEGASHLPISYYLSPLIWRPDLPIALARPLSATDDWPRHLGMTFRPLYEHPRQPEPWKLRPFYTWRWYLTARPEAAV